MKVVSDASVIYLTPENQADCQALERIVERFKVQGFGRCPDSGELIHVGFEVERLDSMGNVEWRWRDEGK